MFSRLLSYPVFLLSFVILTTIFPSKAQTSPRLPVAEPQYINVFLAVDANGKLTELDHQSVTTFRSKVKALPGYATVKVLAEIKPAHASVRLPAGALARTQLLKSKPKRVRYIRSVVSYLDILGFRELIKTRTPGEISRIVKILAESVKPDPLFKKPENIQFTKFSDTVIRSIPASVDRPYNFIFELRSLLNAQVAMVSEGIFVRGAVTVGDIVQSWGIVFGPAVVRAYDLESKKGAPPRIVVDQETLSELARAFEEDGRDLELEGLLRKDGAITYIDYLRACEVEFNVPEQEYPIFLMKHRDLVRDGLKKYNSVPPILAKYRWLAEYHRCTLEDRFDGEVPRHLRI